MVTGVEVKQEKSVSPPLFVSMTDDLPSSECLAAVCGWQAIDREAQDKTKALILNLCNNNDVSFGKFILFSAEILLLT